MSLCCRWGFVTHGGIDGYSRVIVYLQCSISNRSEVVVSAFATACEHYGLPSRVRSDHGGENMLVGLFMNVMHGTSRNSFLTGRSVHNQRIERLWRDVHKEVTSTFYTLFYDMEDRGILDPNNAIHLYALRKVFLPVINDRLTTFRSAWNNHRMRTVNNLTPIQNWTQGQIATATQTSASSSSNSSLRDQLLHRLSSMGVTLPATDGNGSLSDSDQQNTTITLSSEQQQQLDTELTGVIDDEARYEWCVAVLQTFRLD